LKGLKNNKYNSLILTYQIDLHINDIDILVHIKKKLKCGSISKSSNKCNYAVNDQKSLINIILPLFNYSELKSSKYYQFLIFKKVCNLLKDKIHIKDKGKHLILQYYNKMKTSNMTSIARPNVPINQH
jgi:hypothetical protein